MIPICEVKIVATDSGGGAGLAGFIVEATLSKYQLYNGFIVPRTLVAKTDETGRASLKLFPSVLGDDDLHYIIKTTARSGRTLRMIARVPNVASCNLDDIVSPMPSEDDDGCCGSGGGDLDGVILYRQNQFLAEGQQQTASENIGFGDLAPDLLAAFIEGAGITSGGPTYENEHHFGVPPSTTPITSGGISYEGVQTLNDVQQQRAANNIGFGALDPALMSAFLEGVAQPG